MAVIMGVGVAVVFSGDKSAITVVWIGAAGLLSSVLAYGLCDIVLRVRAASEVLVLSWLDPGLVDGITAKITATGDWLAYIPGLDVITASPTATAGTEAEAIKALKAKLEAQRGIATLNPTPVSSQ